MMEWTSENDEPVVDMIDSTLYALHRLERRHAGDKKQGRNYIWV